MHSFLKRICLSTILLYSSLNSEASEEFFLKSAQNYNITASDSRNFVWFRVAKVGTRSILQILRGRAGLFIDAYGVPFYPKRYEDHFKFAFVRNPWDRVVSAYCSKVQTHKHQPFKSCFGKDFEFFVEFINKQDLSSCDAHIMLQTKLMPLDHVDFIGRLENFEEDLKVVLRVIGLDDVEIPHRNASGHVHYSQYYTERTKTIIAKKYAADIKQFGYQFESAD